MTGTDETSRPGRRSKVARLIEEYDLDEIGDEMVRLWTAEGDERRSLRDLAARFNERLLAEAMIEAGIQPLDGEVTNLRRLLTEDGVSSAERKRARRRLERQGIDVDGLVGDFVTYQAIRTYLRDLREAEPSWGREGTVDDRWTNIRRLRERTATITSGELDKLRNQGHITLGEFRTIVTVRVVCEECETQYDVDDIADAGGCNCE